MKKLIAIFSIMLAVTNGLTPSRLLADYIYYDYQPSNEDFCPSCDCVPCQCGYPDYYEDNYYSESYENNYTDANEDLYYSGRYGNSSQRPSQPFIEEQCEYTYPEYDCSYPPPEVLVTTPHFCDPAPVCGTQCGLTVFSIGVAIALVIAVGALVLSSGDGSSGHFAGPGTF